jgi:hypothetical protein
MHYCERSRQEAEKDVTEETINPDCGGKSGHSVSYWKMWQVFTRMWVDPQTQLDMIRPTGPFPQLHAAWAAPLPQNRTELPLQLPLAHPFPVLGDEDHVRLAFPADMGQTLPVVHKVLLPAPADLPGRRTYVSRHALARRIAPKLFGSHGQRPWS